MSFEALNPRLYDKLKKFGQVKVSNAGEAITPWPPVWDDYTGRWKFYNEGEYYQVCCKWCGDSRYRLYVNHMWGQLDPARRPMNFLAICFNRNCLADYATMRAFGDAVEGNTPFRKKDILPGKKLTAEDMKIVWPGPVTRIDFLPSDHEAVHYVQSVRGFDVETLGRYYGVSYCENSVYFLASDRLILPIYRNAKMVGWQARYIGELPWKDKTRRRKLPPKYWAAPRMKKSKVIGNFDNSKKYQTIVLVEGWFDVYRFGPMAGCVFGHSMSPTQLDMVARAVRKYKCNVIHLMDPEVFEEKIVVENCEQLHMKAPRQFAAIKLPDGSDPGSLSREFLHDYVIRAAAEKGLDVSFDKIV